MHLHVTIREHITNEIKTMDLTWHRSALWLPIHTYHSGLPPRVQAVDTIWK